MVNTRDEEVYNFISSFLLKNNISPTFREIVKGTSISSTSTVKLSIDSLVERGLLKRNEYSPRSLQVTGIDYQRSNK